MHFLKGHGYFVWSFGSLDKSLVSFDPLGRKKDCGLPILTLENLSLDRETETD